MLKMDEMKRAAKIRMRGSDLAAVVVDQKSVQELINGKLISGINNVSLDLLKWSYGEPNYTFPDVFSAWSDLNFGFTQLLQEYMEECSRYRKIFKDITAEGKKVTEIQREKEKSAGKVVACRSKLENAKKAKKAEKSKIGNLESELYLAQAKDGEMAEVLKKSLADFELFKAVLLKKSMTEHCQSLMSFFEKSTALCKVKLDVVGSMPNEPALTPGFVADNSSKVEDIFNKLHLQLPPRDPALERNLPAQKFKSLSPPQKFNFGNHSPQSARHTSEPVLTQQSKGKQPMVFSPSSESDESDPDDEHDYMAPDEEMLRKKMAGKGAPKLPPRNRASLSVADEEDCDDMYVVPNLSPCASSPKDVKSEYFEVESDEDTPVMPPSSTNSAQGPPRIQVEQTEPESDPLYFDPEDDEGDDDQLYGNMENYELKEHQQKSGGVTPTQAPPVKLRKPAVFPKLYQQKAVKDPPPKSPRTPDVIEDDDIYACVYEEESPPKSGGSRPTPSARTPFQCLTVETCPVKETNSYVNVVCKPSPTHEQTCDENDSVEHKVNHTYFHFQSSNNDIKKLPVPTRKPQSPPMKPVAAVRSRVK